MSIYPDDLNYLEGCLVLHMLQKGKGSFMDTLHAHRFGRVLALGWLIVLLAACSVADPAVGSAHAVTALPLGSTFWTYRGVSSVFTAAWSPDGKRLALGEADGTVQVRDAITDNILFTAHGHANHVWAGAWSAVEKSIAFGSQDRTVRVWGGRTGRTMMIYRGHTKGVQAVAWSPDGRYFASGSWDTTVQVWKVTTGHRILTYRGHADIVGAVAWSPDGRRIASAGDDVRIWRA